MTPIECTIEISKESMEAGHNGYTWFVSGESATFPLEEIKSYFSE